MSGQTVTGALDRAIGTGPVPESITTDHGTEFISRALEDWAYRRGVQLDFTRPGKRTDNSYIESFNGKLRDDCLNVTQFDSLAHAPARSELGRSITMSSGPTALSGTSPRGKTPHNVRSDVAVLSP
jgi:transposase InsO family protein